MLNNKPFQKIFPKTKLKQLEDVAFANGNSNDTLIYDGNNWINTPSPFIINNEYKSIQSTLGSENSYYGSIAIDCA